MATKPERLGTPSKNFAHLGVHNVCMGPNAPTLTGPYLQIVIYDRDNNIVRRMEERKTEIVPAYVSFFEERCHPGVYEHYLVDIDGRARKRSSIVIRRVWPSISRHG